MAATEYDAIVVGAGYAGVTAARDLRDSGLSVLLLEGAERLGGRTFSGTFRGREEQVEFGGGWVDLPIHPNVRREVQRYGVELADPGVLPQSAHFYTAGERRMMPVPTIELWALEAVILRLHQAAARLTHAGPLHSQAVSDLDVSAAEFFRPLQLPPGTRDLIYALMGANAGAEPDDVSMLWLLGLIAAGGGSPFGYFMFSGSSGSYTFAHGTRDLLSRMVADSGVELKLGARATAIVQRGATVAVTTADGSEYTARSSVVAVPTNVVRQIRFEPDLQGEQAEAVAGNHPGRAYKIWIVAENIPRAPICIGMAPLQAILPFRALGEGRWLLAAFGAEGVAALDLLDRHQVQDALRHYIPDAVVVACDAHDWGKDPLFDGTYRVDPPGAHQDAPRVMGKPHGRIVFAGADIEEGLFRNTIEGAITSGARAAAHVHDLVVTRP